MRNWYRRICILKTLYTSPKKLRKKKILSQAQPKKGEVWWDSTEGNDRIWVLKRGKDLLTALSTNYRSCHCQGAGSPHSKRKGWGRQREVWSQSVDERFWSETSCPHEQAGDKSIFFTVAKFLWTLSSGRLTPTSSPSRRVSPPPGHPASLCRHRSTQTLAWC